jgi:hypothetical protein
LSEEYELIKGCIRQDAKCQRMLFDRYAGKMMGVCLRYANDSMEAEDMLQDAFIKVFQYIGQFKFEGAFEGMDPEDRGEHGNPSPGKEKTALQGY